MIVDASITKSKCRCPYFPARYNTDAGFTSIRPRLSRLCERSQRQCAKLLSVEMHQNRPE
jgi:hypothetical protein